MYIWIWISAWFLSKLWLQVTWASLMALQVKNPPEMQKTQETWVPLLGWESPLVEEIATHSRILAKIIMDRGAWQATIQRVRKSSASPVAHLGKNPPVTWETWVRSLLCEDPLEKGKATNSSILPWRIPLTVYSMGSQRVGHNWATFTSLHKELDTHWVTEPPLQVTYLTTLCPSLLIYYICIMSFVWYTTNAHHVTYLLSPQLSIVHL